MASDAQRIIVLGNNSLFSLFSPVSSSFTACCLTRRISTRLN